MSASHVHVIGASGRSGTALARILGPRIVPVVRDAVKWTALGFGIVPKVADLADRRALAQSLRGATHVVSCAHARHTETVIRAAPEDPR